MPQQRCNVHVQVQELHAKLWIGSNGPQDQVWNPHITQLMLHAATILRTLTAEHAPAVGSGRTAGAAGIWTMCLASLCYTEACFGTAVACIALQASFNISFPGTTAKAKWLSRQGSARSKQSARSVRSGVRSTTGTAAGSPLTNLSTTQQVPEYVNPMLWAAAVQQEAMHGQPGQSRLTTDCS